MTEFTRTWRLVRLAVRRERLVLPIWVVSIAGLAWGVVASYQSTLPSQAERVATATFSAGNPLARIFDGPASGTEIGAMALVEGWKILAILTSLMAAQAVVRHTRSDEEAGRAELVGSSVVGRFAPLSAALVVALGASLLVGLAVAVAIAAPTGLAWSGAWAAGMAAAGMGWVFAGVAAVAAQVLSTSRGANGVVGGVLGISFALRAFGDVTGTLDDSGVVVHSRWMSWLSPYGWGQQVRPYSQDNWWVAGLFVAATLLLVAVAFALSARRDVGLGMIPPRLGPATAPAGLLSPVGLAWRLQRGTVLFWLIGMAIAGLALGSLGDDVDAFLADNETLEALLDSLVPGGDIVDLFYVLTMTLVGLASAAYVVQGLLRMRAEEVSGRVEPLLATAVSRHRWLAAHVVIVAAGVSAMLLAAGACSALTYLAAGGRGGAGGIVAAALVQIPAVLALGGFVLAAFGLVPRWAGSITWVALAVALVMSQLGALFELPEWLLNLSPFTHIPLVPAESFAFAPVLWLGAVAVALGTVGFAAFRHRDLAIGA